MARSRSPLARWAAARPAKAAASSLPVCRPDLIALVHPAICWSHGMPGRPVHFESFSACAKAGAVIDASPSTVAESISAPASAARTIVFTDHPSQRLSGCRFDAPMSDKVQSCRLFLAGGVPSRPALLAAKRARERDGRRAASALTGHSSKEVIFQANAHQAP